ncbi:uncharacterized protein VTP21DRAFT_6350 [Calcarisporiella thermophila]|uniref:uncharacterized protein n=1 Tax=Calcarisporiella thermophila TaxID=911321 RepID=UPI0037446821
MRRGILFWIYCACWLTCMVYAETAVITINDLYPQKCSGVWADASGGRNSSITLTFDDDSTGELAVVIYDWTDFDKLGYKPDNSSIPYYVCDEEALARGYCNSSMRGSYIISPGYNNAIITHAFNLTSGSTDRQLEYSVSTTSYYCAVISLVSGSANYRASVRWQQPYGELPASDYPKLVYFRIQTIALIAIGAFWLLLSFRYWRNILPVQNYVSIVIFMAMIQHAFTWAYWNDYNIFGRPSWILLSLSVVLNAAKNSLSFFMLLIVSMGYSVAKPSLGITMKRCASLAYAHFLFGVLYEIGTTLMTPDSATILALLVILPLAITLTAFYTWTLQSIKTTIGVLELRHQKRKVRMYRRLHLVLLVSVWLIFFMFLVNLVNFIARAADPLAWSAAHWKWRWFLMDGWMNVLYFGVLLVIVFLWRPSLAVQTELEEEEQRVEEEGLVGGSDPAAEEVVGLEGVGGRGRLGYHKVENNGESEGVFGIGEEDSDEEVLSKGRGGDESDQLAKRM